MCMRIFMFMYLISMNDNIYILYMKILIQLLDLYRARNGNTGVRQGKITRSLV